MEKSIEKVEQDRHINSHNIDKELNINHKTVLNYLEKNSIKELDGGCHMM